MSWAHVATSLPCPVKPPRSRHRFHVATSWRPSHVATSHWCRDTVSLAQPQARSPPYVATSISCRDLLHDQPMSRHQVHVATSSSCRDIKFPTGQVATSVPCRDLLETNLCRDIVFMSRPPRLMSMSRHQAQPSHCRPCRDLTMMSRHQACSAPFLLRRDAKRCRDLALAANHVATSQ